MNEEKLKQCKKKHLGKDSIRVKTKKLKHDNLTEKEEEKNARLKDIAESFGFTAIGIRNSLTGPDLYLLENSRKNEIQAKANENSRKLLRVYSMSRAPACPVYSNDDVIKINDFPSSHLHFSSSFSISSSHCSSSNLSSSLPSLPLLSNSSTFSASSAITCANHYFMNSDLDTSNEADFTSENVESDFLVRMQMEILDFLIYATPSSTELYCKCQALTQLEFIAKCLFPKSHLQIFGSYYTGLALPGSDIDVCLMNVEGDSRTNLKVLALHLCRLEVVHGIEIISTARVPIVKVVDYETGTQLDISINQESALATSNFVREQLQKFVQLRSLIILIKLFLQMRGLGETYKGGVGSYLLFCMVLNFLQLHKSSCDTPTFRRTLTSELLIDFFFYWGFQKNIQNFSASVRGIGHVFPKELRANIFMTKPHLLSMESPLEPSVDLGRNAFNIQFVISSFQQAWMDLMARRVEWKNSWRNSKMRKSNIIELLYDMEHPIFSRREYNDTFGIQNIYNANSSEKLEEGRSKKKKLLRSEVSNSIGSVVCVPTASCGGHANEVPNTSCCEHYGSYYSFMMHHDDQVMKRNVIAALLKKAYKLAFKNMKRRVEDYQEDSKSLNFPMRLENSAKANGLGCAKVSSAARINVEVDSSSAGISGDSSDDMAKSGSNVKLNKYKFSYADFAEDALYERIKKICNFSSI